jgi:hypothetical protein
MTSSDDDDLEHELQENLKLRRELGTEAAKAEGAIDAKQGSRIAYRLGWVLYWICLALAVVWVVVFFLGSGEGSQAIQFLLKKLREDPLSFGLFFGLPPLILYGLGRTFRYFLSGK